MSFEFVPERSPSRSWASLLRELEQFLCLNFGTDLLGRLVGNEVYVAVLPRTSADENLFRCPAASRRA
eukprot:551762-Pyramimonas_sp.AAC.1